ncbi:stalk domain-containing protein [Cohnella herbarum]|uniref:Copper amine oxidase n=1 Tax=Cohnella herbarum TaxID=2728023 RepID=A0A7Z2VKV5_9BACL|nr:stalk domain-containing protein [Cohnella herbarum]QJD84924.1 copper amine oxidase [Cohnella herbarum]
MKKSILSLALATLLGSGLSSVAAAETQETYENSTIKDYDPYSIVKKDGTYWVWGRDHAVPTQLPALTEVEQMYPGGFFTKKDHTVWMWEKESYFSVKAKVYPVTRLSNLIGVFANYHGDMLALDSNGTVYRIPKEDNKPQLDQIAPLIGIENVVDINPYYENYENIEKRGEWRWTFLKSDGTVWKDSNSLTSFDPIQSLEHVVSLDYNLALKSDGTVWTWPTILTDEESSTGQWIPTQVMGLENISKINGRLAIDSESRLWFWGSTITGFSDGTMTHEVGAPMLLTSINNVKEAYLVERSLIVRTKDDKVYEASIERERMPTDPEFKHIASDVSEIKAGNRFIIMRKKNGTLWGWGVNKNHDLGYGDNEFMHSVPVPVQKPISISLNGEQVVMNNGVVVRNEQVFVPLRSIFEKLGATIKWDNTDKIVTITREAEGDKPAITILVNYREGMTEINGIKSVNNPFNNVGGTSYLPLRLISESLGAKVHWIQKEDKISITMN